MDWIVILKLLFLLRRPVVTYTSLSKCFSFSLNRTFIDVSFFS